MPGMFVVWDWDLAMGLIASTIDTLLFGRALRFLVFELISQAVLRGRRGSVHSCAMQISPTQPNTMLS